MGCGGCELLRRLQLTARLAVGVDLSVAGLRLARAGAAGSGRDVPIKRVLCARAEALPFADGSFEAVVAQHLVEHLPDPQQALREWRRVLKQGGTLVIVTPNAAYPDPCHFADPGHASLFTLATLRSALEGAGFQVARLTTLFPYLGRGRIPRAASIRLARIGDRLPGLIARGRSLVAAGTRTQAASTPRAVCRQTPAAR